MTVVLETEQQIRFSVSTIKMKQADLPGKSTFSPRLM